MSPQNNNRDITVEDTLHMGQESAKVALESQCHVMSNDIACRKERVYSY